MVDRQTLTTTLNMIDLYFIQLMHSSVGGILKPFTFQKQT